MTNKWLKPFLTLLTVGLLASLLPSAAVDPWNLLSPKKLATMIFALAFIQVFGSVLNRILGLRTGAILTGFLGGLVSSTATTASLARKSKIESRADSTSEMLIFLSATGAMLVEGFALVWAGTSGFNLTTLFVFVGPLIATGTMIYFYSCKVTDHSAPSEDIEFKVLPIFKLSIFIVSILGLSKLLQNFFGQNGLMILTFLVSLFEIHGSVIANVQLHQNKIINSEFLSGLVAISIVASYLSKVFLISTLGSAQLRVQSIKSSLFLLLSLSISWWISIGLTDGAWFK